MERTLILDIVLSSYFCYIIINKDLLHFAGADQEFDFYNYHII